MTALHLIGVFLFFLAFNAIVLGGFLWLLRKWNGGPLEFGSDHTGDDK